MKKIKVQTRLNPFVYILILLFIITFISAVFYYVIFNSSDLFSAKSKYDVWELVFVIGILLPFLFRDFMKKGQYVSEIIIDKGLLQLVYEDKGKVIEVKSIALSDVESFNIRTTAELQQSSRKSFYVFSHFITILLKNKEKIVFDSSPLQMSFGCQYQILLDLLSISQLIPNFSYDLDVADENIIEEIDYFKKFGKRMPFQKKKMGIGKKLALGTILFASIYIVFVFVFVFCLPSTTPKSDDSYVSIYSQINKYRKNNDYTTALKLVNNAKVMAPNDYNVYLTEAQTYEKMKDYKKEIESAEKALTLLNSKEKSRYDKAFGKDNLIARHVFKSGNEGFVRAYTLLGYANYEMKNYSEAVKNYTHVIDKTTYKYSDAYLYRGVSLYYLGNKEKALQDFFKQQEIVNNYIAEMPGVRYPQYNRRDLDKINLWIKACQN